MTPSLPTAPQCPRGLTRALRLVSMPAGRVLGFAALAALSPCVAGDSRLGPPEQPISIAAGGVLRVERSDEELDASREKAATREEMEHLHLVGSSDRFSFWRIAIYLLAPLLLLLGLLAILRLV